MTTTLHRLGDSSSWRLFLSFPAGLNWAELSWTLLRRLHIITTCRVQSETKEENGLIQGSWRLVPSHQPIFFFSKQCYSRLHIEKATTHDLMFPSGINRNSESQLYWKWENLNIYFFCRRVCLSLQTQLCCSDLYATASPIAFIL